MASGSQNMTTYKAKQLVNTYGSDTKPVYINAGVPTILGTIGGQYNPVWVNSGVITAITAGTTGQFYRGDKTWSNTLVGAFTCNSTLTVNAENSTTEGGQICLKADPNHSAYHAYLDVCNNYFRVHSNGEERISVELASNGVTNIRGKLIVNQPNEHRDNGIYGTYIYTKAATIWSMGTAYKIAADGSGLGSLYGAAYAYQDQAYIGSKRLAGGHQFLWCENGGIDVALGSNGVWIKKGGGIYWDPYVESASDASYVTSIYQIASGVAGGTELRINQQNDAADCINLCTNAYIYLNSKRAFTINDSWLRINENAGFSSGTYFGATTVRTDGTLQVGSSGANFYANSSGNGYFSNTLGIGATNTSYKLTINGGTLIKGANFIEFENSGSWGASSATFPNNRGGLYWSGTSDWVRIFCTETASDNFQLIVDFGDDTSQSMILRDRGTNKITLTPSSSTISATTFSGNATSASALATYASIGSSTTDHGVALKNWFTSNKSTAPRNQVISFYSATSGNGSQYMGYFLSGYADNPYGGFFVCHYNNPYYVGIQNGTYTQQHILTSTNYTSYTVTKTGSGASGTWGISITGNAGGSSSSCTGNAATASSANVLSINNTQSLSNCLQYIQTSAQTSNKDLPTSAWWHCIKMNHGNGGTYYKRVLAFNFWGQADIRTATAEGNGTTTAWKRVWCEGNSVTSAVWNDYAECRETQSGAPGQCVYELGDDTLAPTNERLQPAAGIISDTWGFSQGETETAKTPIAVAGRVLAYTYRCRDEYKPGDTLCAAPGGTVDIMTREEIREYPDRIVGIVSCIPDYEYWGAGEGSDRKPVEVDGRIWIKVQ